jgi:hypothetical protein
MQRRDFIANLLLAGSFAFSATLSARTSANESCGTRRSESLYHRKGDWI